MKTAIDFLFENLKSHFEHDGDLLETVTFSYAIAKKKEREQIEQAFNKGRFSKKKAQQYYTETYANSINNT
jgi:hemerythrin